MILVDSSDVVPDAFPLRRVEQFGRQMGPRRQDYLGCNARSRPSDERAVVRRLPGIFRVLASPRRDRPSMQAVSSEVGRI